MKTVLLSNSHNPRPTSMRFLLFFLLAGTSAMAQPTLSVHVQEVHLLLHAEDAHGHPIDTLQADQLLLKDNDKAQKILSLTMRNDLPLRIAFMIDTSVSMRGYSVLRSRNIASRVVEQLGSKDQAYVQEFDFEDLPSSNFSSDHATLQTQLNQVGARASSRLGGTAIYDTLYRSCRDHFHTSGDGSTSNAIFLFTDGEDNASHAYLQEAVEECQSVRTPIYVFSAVNSAEPKHQGHLYELALMSDGKLFPASTTDTDYFMHDAFHYGFYVPRNMSLLGISKSTLEQVSEVMVQLHHQYELVYRPSNLQTKQRFHRIRIKPVLSGVSIQAREGYETTAQP